MKAYSRLVSRMTARSILLLAVLVMPLSMAFAGASASPVDHQEMMAGMPTGHCPDQSTKHMHSDGLAACSMACASALPAQDVARDETTVRVVPLVNQMVAQTLPGVLLEIATPPPKFA